LVCESKDWIDLDQDTDRWGHLWVRSWTFGFHKMRVISWLAGNQLASKGDSAPWIKYSTRHYRPYLPFPFYTHISLLISLHKHLKLVDITCFDLYCLIIFILYC
jgi:hypothetical protein